MELVRMSFSTSGTVYSTAISTLCEDSTIFLFSPDLTFVWQRRKISMWVCPCSRKTSPTGSSNAVVALAHAHVPLRTGSAVVIEDRWPWALEVMKIGVLKSSTEGFHKSMSSALLSLQSIVVHARVRSQEDPVFIGSVTYEYLSQDGETQRRSYLDDKARHNHVRSSLFSADNHESSPVGCVVMEGQTKWYVVDRSGSLVFLPQNNDGKFFRAGVGNEEHLRFWDPVKNQICRADFLGVERPDATSPQQYPYDTTSFDLVQGMSSINLHTTSADRGKQPETYSESYHSPSTYSPPMQTTSNNYSAPTVNHNSTDWTQLSSQVGSSATILDSAKCVQVTVTSAIENKGKITFICSSLDGREIELSGRRWFKSSITHDGTVYSCCAYYGRSGNVYYAWNIPFVNDS